MAVGDCNRCKRDADPITIDDNGHCNACRKELRREAPATLVSTHPRKVRPCDWTAVKRVRNRLLAETDWTQLWDVRNQQKPEVLEAWAKYRQALRDITKDFTQPETVVWPTKPQED